MEQFKIVADSSADTLSLQDTPYSYAPLKILTADKEYVDNEALDVKSMTEDLLAYKGRSSTSCPNPEDWRNAFGDARYIFCVTITGTLSGSYNAAVVAKQLYEDAHPERRVFVINSLSAGPELKLIIEKLSELIAAGLEYDEICRQITDYMKSTGLVFMLCSMKNLANNGRVNPIVAKAAGLLGIRVVGKASDQGDLQPLDKCRGKSKALLSLIDRMREQGLNKGKVRIAHCFNPSDAQELKDMLIAQFPQVHVEIYPCRGLCSFYAEKGGMLVGFEKF